MKILIPFLFVFSFWACKPIEKNSLPFLFNDPDEIIQLPKSLHEISGITFYRKNELACVQDEKGIIFFYDIKKDKLRKKVQFSSDKDYEGIANINDTLYVLCSNGTLSQVDALKEDSYTQTYHTFLSKENNCEGLCYDKRRNSLLIACKDKPEKGTAPHGTKAIYRFDPSTGILDENPVYRIDPDSVLAHLIHPERKGFFQRIFGNREAELNNHFEPSDLSIDPLTGDIYVISSRGKMILIMSYDGNIKFALRLDPEIYKQPEGITFSESGDILISDEGKSGKANLIRLYRKTFE